MPARRAKHALVYHVQPGDSLWTIAKAFDVSRTRLMRLNHVGPQDVLKVGQALSIPRTETEIVRLAYL